MNRWVQICWRDYGLKSPTGRLDTDDWAALPRPVLVAEAMVQELLVCLIEVRMEERKRLVMDEVDSIDAMKRLHSQIAVDKELVRSIRARVCKAQTQIRSSPLNIVVHYCL